MHRCAVRLGYWAEVSRSESATAVMGRAPVTSEQLESISSIMAEVCVVCDISLFREQIKPPIALTPKMMFSALSNNWRMYNLQGSHADLRLQERILDVLVEIYDPDLLGSVLDDALTPPSPEQQNANSDEEFVYTTPYRLVQAIDKRLIGNPDMDIMAKQQLITLRELALERYESSWNETCNTNSDMLLMCSDVEGKVYVWAFSIRGWFKGRAKVTSGDELLSDKQQLQCRMCSA